MRFNKEDANNNLLKEDLCDFEILEAKDTKSKSSGNEMIELLLKAWDVDGKEGTFKAYLVTVAQVKSFCIATNQMSKFEAESLEASDCINKTGKFMNRREVDNTGQYADKNSVRYWASPQAKSKNTATSANQSMQNLTGKTDSGFVSKQEQLKNAADVKACDGAFDDDIPF